MCFIEQLRFKYVVYNYLEGCYIESAIGYVGPYGLVLMAVPSSAWTSLNTVMGRIYDGGPIIL
jgi:hypothetical protein